MKLDMDYIEMQFEMEALEKQFETEQWTQYEYEYYEAIKNELNRIEREWNEYIKQFQKDN
jgi:hypothetical protein